MHTPQLPQLSTSLATYSAQDPGGWQHIIDRARMLDEVGFDRLVVSDHVVFGERLEEYSKPSVGGQRGGKQPTGPDGHWLEPLTLLSMLAGVTTEIRLGTNIVIAALRRPVVLAKTAATLDVLSGGRFDLGVGVGWQREEYEAAGLNFDARGRLLDHSLEVCQTLWREMRASYQSPELKFDAIHMMPKPLGNNGVPVWVSGTVNPKVISRVARFAYGWIPWGDDAADIATGISKMKAGIAEHGRDAEGLEVVATLRPIKGTSDAMDIPATMAQVPALVAAGATDLRMHLAFPADRSEAFDHCSALVAGFRSAAQRG